MLKVELVIKDNHSNANRWNLNFAPVTKNYQISLSLIKCRFINAIHASRPFKSFRLLIDFSFAPSSAFIAILAGRILQQCSGSHFIVNFPFFKKFGQQLSPRSSEGINFSFCLIRTFFWSQRKSELL